MAVEIEKDWKTAAGFRAICIKNHGRHLNHRCGYIEVPQGHPLHGVSYDKGCPALLESPESKFRVHGGLTFSELGFGGYPAQSTGWWFGFDCAHAGDRPEIQTTEYVVAECESLAKQIADAVTCVTP